MKRERHRDYVPWRIYFRGFFSRTPRCTRCSNKRISPSRQPADFVSRWSGLTPYRCHGCNMLFVLRLSKDSLRARRAHAASEDDTPASA